jgi:hypothetical protein
MKKQKNSSAAGACFVCCVLALLNVAAANAQDNASPPKRENATAAAVLQAKEIRRKLKKDVAPFVDSTGCSLHMYLYVERVEGDEEANKVFDIVKLIKTAAKKILSGVPARIYPPYWLKRHGQRRVAGTMWT